MKIHIDIDCTPKEARAFLGLPDVAPVRERVLQEMEGRMMEALAQMDPKAVLDQWLPVGMQGMQQWQSLWAEMLKQATGLDERPEARKAGRKGRG